MEPFSPDFVRICAAICDSCESCDSSELKNQQLRVFNPALCRGLIQEPGAVKDLLKPLWAEVQKAPLRMKAGMSRFSPGSSMKAGWGMTASSG